jgi:hypothetical protein
LHTTTVTARGSRPLGAVNPSATRPSRAPRRHDGNPHPTLSETLMNAGEVYFGTATEIYKPKRR